MIEDNNRLWGFIFVSSESQRFTVDDKRSYLGRMYKMDDMVTNCIAAFVKNK